MRLVRLLDAGEGNTIIITPFALLARSSLVVSRTHCRWWGAGSERGE